MSLRYNDQRVRSRYAGRIREVAILTQPLDRAFAVVTGLFVVLFGLAFGSFLNVCISRLPRHESIIDPPSRCPRCRARIRAVDNIPLLSWLLLRGRCRRCRARIHWRYPAVEASIAALFLLCWLQFGLTLTGYAMMVLGFLLFGLAVMDAETMRLPDAFTLPGIALGIVYAALSGRDRLAGAGFAMLWAVAAALLILAMRWGYFLVRRTEGMGMGDVKLMAMIGAWLGPALTLLTLFLGVTSSAIFGLGIIAARRGNERALSMRLPFGAFLCAAALYAIFAGRPIVAWYLRFFR
jgi:leader peptidase (prepilin peptidase)/N-methyltransferase